MADSSTSRPGVCNGSQNFSKLKAFLIAFPKAGSGPRGVGLARLSGAPVGNPERTGKVDLLSHFSPKIYSLEGCMPWPNHLACMFSDSDDTKRLNFASQVGQWSGLFFSLIGQLLWVTEPGNAMKAKNAFNK